MLPEPTLTLTLPSIHDTTPLDVRIYHPLSLSTTSTRHAAIVAHPYAPLGGSYDDPIVEDVAGLLLRRGFIVATFNFRGAAGSAGRTSWTSKPERGDYMTVVGFLVYYIHHLGALHTGDDENPMLLMAGYSYGAMITTQLPPLADVLARFSSPTTSSEAGQIRTRAESLGTQQRELMHAHSRRSLRVGEGSPKRSHDGRRSFSLDDAEEKLRKGVQHFMAKTKHGSRTNSSIGLKATPPPELVLSPITNLVHPIPAYLVVSPLQGMISHLATLSRSPQDSAAEAKFRESHTLAVYGDGDVFVSAQKLRAWTMKIEGMEQSLFRGKEIKGAGHFWVEEGVLDTMMGHVEGFVRELLDGSLR